ncbi:ATP-binding protein, partial [Streptomyces sp. NPDC056341]
MAAFRGKRRWDPAVLGTRLESSVLSPLLKQLLPRDGPGAGLVDKPVSLSGLVTFRGEKRTLGEKEVGHLAARPVREAVQPPGEPPFPADEQEAITAALARRVLALGDLDMDDVQAACLGHRQLARTLREAAPVPGLTTDAAYFLDSVTEWACLHIPHFVTRRSTFVARTLVEQSRAQSELITKVDALITKVDALITRTPPHDGQDTAFEARYRAHLAERHNRVTIFGLDLRDSPVPTLSLSGALLPPAGIALRAAGRTRPVPCPCTSRAARRTLPLRPRRPERRHRAPFLRRGRRTGRGVRRSLPAGRGHRPPLESPNHGRHGKGAAPGPKSWG